MESVYSTFYKPFNHIATVTDGDSSKLAKLFQFGKALAKFLWWMIFHREIKIVHVHGASNASFWRKRILINIAKSFGKKVVFHLHGGMFQSFYAHHPKTVRKTRQSRSAQHSRAGIFFFIRKLILLYDSFCFSPQLRNCRLRNKSGHTTICQAFLFQPGQRCGIPGFHSSVFPEGVNPVQSVNSSRYDCIFALPYSSSVRPNSGS